MKRRGRESNLRPHGCRSDALNTTLLRHLELTFSNIFVHELGLYLEAVVLVKCFQVREKHFYMITADAVDIVQKLLSVSYKNADL